MVIIWVIGPLKMQGFLQAMNLNIKLTLRYIYIWTDSHKLFQLLLIRKLLDYRTDAFTNEWNRIIKRWAVYDFLGHTKAHFYREDVLWLDDLIYEVSKLLRLYEILKQLIVKESQSFIDQLKCSNSKLRIDHNFIHVKYSWQCNFGKDNNSTLVLFLDLKFSFFCLKFLLPHSPFQMWW